VPFAPAAAPGPLADPALHQVVRPTVRPAAEPVDPAPAPAPVEPPGRGTAALPVVPGTEHWSPFPPVSGPPSDAPR